MKKTKTILLSCLAASVILALPAGTASAKDLDKLRIAVINMQPVWGDKQANLKKILSYSKEAASMGAKMIVFPEMALTGYAMEQGDGIKRADRMQVKLAEPADGEAASAVADAAKKLKAYIAYGYPEKKGDAADDVYNSVLVAGPDGIIGSYQKIHPFGSEVIWCKTGTDPFMFDTPWGKVGVSICYDTYNYPELTRYYAASGARLILNPTATSWAYYSAKHPGDDGLPLNDGKPYADNNKAWVNRFMDRIEATVVQSGVYVASADLVGSEKKADGTFMGTAFPGGSCVVGPSTDTEGTESYIDYYGTNPAKATAEGIYYSDVDLSTAKRNSFVNYIKTDAQEGNLYSPALYAKWFEKLAGEYKELNH
jgi:predicted amidohydrolase